MQDLALGAADTGGRDGLMGANANGVADTGIAVNGGPEKGTAEPGAADTVGVLGGPAVVGSGGWVVGWLVLGGALGLPVPSVGPGALKDPLSEAVGIRAGSKLGASVDSLSRQ